MAVPTSSTSAGRWANRPHGHDAGELVDAGLERDRVDDVESVHVEDVVAVVGDDVPSRQTGATAEPRQLARHVGARHRDHFDRQRETAEPFDELLVVGDADEAAGRRRNDLFAGERRAATLDQVQVAGRLVGAVDVDVEFAGRR